VGRPRRGGRGGPEDRAARRRGLFRRELARAAAGHGMALAIGAKRISSMWKALAAVPEDAWRDAIDMENAQVAAVGDDHAVDEQLG
jgi:hypothetical protein